MCGILWVLSALLEIQTDGILKDNCVFQERKSRLRYERVCGEEKDSRSGAPRAASGADEEKPRPEWREKSRDGMGLRRVVEGEPGRLGDAVCAGS